MNNNFLLRANLLFIMSKYDDEKKSFYDKLTEITDELFDISNKNNYGFTRKEIEDFVRPNIAQNNFGEQVISDGYIPW